MAKKSQEANFANCLTIDFQLRDLATMARAIGEHFPCEESDRASLLSDRFLMAITSIVERDIRQSIQYQFELVTKEKEDGEPLAAEEET